jgi:Domain of unknown function (DUF5047)
MGYSMIPVSPITLEAFRYSHNKVTVVDVYHGDRLVSGPDNPLLVSSGTVTADRNQKARRSLQCVVPMTQWHEPPPLDVWQTRVHVSVGYDIGGSVEAFSVGVFRINEIGRTSSGELTLSGTSLESYVIDNSVLDVSEYGNAGNNCIDSIKRLITSSFSGASAPEFEITAEAQAMAGVTLANDLAVGERWALIESYAFAIDCDVYCAPYKTPKGAPIFRIAKTPDVMTGTPVLRLSEGADGVLVSLNTRTSRDKIYNGVQVIAQSSNYDVPPISGDMITELLPPYDPVPAEVRWGGLFGKRPLVFTDPSADLTTKADCNLKAQKILAEMLAEERTLDLSAVPNPALEPDDIIEVLTYHPITGQEQIQKHMLTQMTIPLGLGDWSAQTLSNRTDEALNQESPLKPPTN